MSGATARDPGDTITVLLGRGRRLAKLIEADGTIVGYDSARTFDLEEQQIADLDALRGLLDRLLGQPDRCAVRGRIADPARTRGVRRLIRPDPETGEEATLIDVPRRWCALDIDGLERPRNIAAADIFDCGIEAVMHLPTPFRGAGCVVQASASHGLKPGLRLRLWFRLSRPTTGAELRFWLRNVPADPAIFSAAQIIYTAAPVFAGGRADPLPRRITELPGGDLVTVPDPAALRAPPPPPPRPLPAPGDTRAARYAAAALRNETTRIALAPIGSRHAEIVRAARALGRFAAGGLLAESDVRQAIVDAAALAGKDAAEAEAAFAWAFAHPSAAPLPECAR